MEEKELKYDKLCKDLMEIPKPLTMVTFPNFSKLSGVEYGFLQVRVTSAEEKQLSSQDRGYVVHFWNVLMPYFVSNWMHRLSSLAQTTINQKISALPFQFVVNALKNVDIEGKVPWPLRQPNPYWNDPNWCNVCGESYIDKPRFLAHYNYDHSVQEATKQKMLPRRHCDACPQIFDSTENYIIHLKGKWLARAALIHILTLIKENRPLEFN